MPLLNLKPSKKVNATVTLESETVAQLNHYAAFTNVSADAVIDSALQYLFAKDKDFRAHLGKHGSKAAPASLRVKKSGGFGAALIQEIAAD